jgi:uncharacterized membrane protein YgcG
MSLCRMLAATFALGLVTSPTQAAEPIGAAVVVVNQVTAMYNRDTRTLAQGGNVHQDELIEVATDASSELKLNDETKMALGPGAKLMLDKFVYDGEKTKGNIAVNLVKGAFRFVTGVAAKPSYVVRVPQASITVRGTIFDVFVQDNGVSWLLLHEGAVNVCNERGKCRDLDEPGKLIRITDGDVGAPSRWTNLKQKTNFDDAFPFVGKKPQDSPPVLTRDAILIDIVPPKKDKPTRKTDRGDDDGDKPSKTTKKKRTEKASRDDDKPKRKRVSRRDDDDDDNQKIMDGVGIAIGIAGGIRFGKGGGGGRGGYGGGGKSMGGGGRMAR